MTPSWSSPQTIGGLLAVVLFGVLCLIDLRKGVVAFTAFGCIRNLQIGAFSGSEMVQGLLPVEALATVMCLVWLIHRLVYPKSAINRAPFNQMLLLLIPSAVISLIVGFIWFDPMIPVDHMKLSVSVGQILLIVWPIGIYLVVANSMVDTKTIEIIRKVIVGLAVPSLALTVAPVTWDYVSWSTTFALPASSLCFAEFFDVRPVSKRLFLLVMAVAPIVYGVTMGKAFYYGYVFVSMGVIGCLKARGAMLALAPVALAAYVVAVPLASGSLTPNILSSLVEQEEEQQSIGGTGGRDQLIVDGLGIWSRYPIFGVGPGNNYPYMLRYSTLGTAHNQYVNILIELGAIGLVIFLAFAWRAIRMGLKLWRTATEPVHRTLVLGWLGIFTGMLVGGFFGDFMLPSIRNDGLGLFAQFYVQWIILGLVVAASALEQRRAGYKSYVHPQPLVC